MTYIYLLPVEFVKQRHWIMSFFSYSLVEASISTE